MLANAPVPELQSGWSGQLQLSGSLSQSYPGQSSKSLVGQGIQSSYDTPF